MNNSTNKNNRNFISFVRMVKNEFQSLGIQPRTNASYKWYQERLRGYQAGIRNAQKDLIENPYFERKQRMFPGEMYFFSYSPKYAKTLPYYDRFPLVIVVDRVKNGFQGLNLHYLPLPLRAQLFDALLETATNSRYDQKTKLKLNYSLLTSVSKMKYFEPCFKRYLNSHVTATPRKVHAYDWEFAVFLPIQKFAKAKATQVWSDSRKKFK